MFLFRSTRKFNVVVVVVDLRPMTKLVYLFLHLQKKYQKKFAH